MERISSFEDLFNMLTLTDWLRLYLKDVFPVITVDLVSGQAVRHYFSVKKTGLTFSALTALASVNQSLSPVLEGRRFLHRVYSQAAFVGRISLLSRLPTSLALSCETRLSQL